MPTSFASPVADDVNTYRAGPRPPYPPATPAPATHNQLVMPTSFAGPVSNEVNTYLAERRSIDTIGTIRLSRMTPAMLNRAPIWHARGLECRV